jgi:cytochrome c oxidase subunit 3
VTNNPEFGHAAAGHAAQHADHHQQAAADNRTLGIWIFLSGECAFFASLIGTFLALHTNTAGGPTGAQLFDLPYTGAATLVLLTSSLTAVLGTVALQRGNLRGLQAWLLVTAFLGVVFLEFEGFEFYSFWQQGLTLSRSAFGSAFYTLVGFHAMHVSFGVFWLLSLLFLTIRKGLNVDIRSRLYIAGLYWHFVDVVWVVIFTVVYLLGKVG